MWVARAARKGGPPPHGLRPPVALPRLCRGRLCEASVTKRLRSPMKLRQQLRGESQYPRPGSTWCKGGSPRRTRRMLSATSRAALSGTVMLARCGVISTFSMRQSG